MMRNGQNSRLYSAVRASRIITMVREQDHIEDGVLILQQTHDGMRIADIGPYDKLKRLYKTTVQDLGKVTVVPGLINSHTHLELSHLAGKTHLHNGFVTWLQSLVPFLPHPPDTRVLDNTIQAMQENGTVFAADMAGRFCSLLSERLEANRLDHYLMVQYFGFSDFPRSGVLPVHPYEAALPQQIRDKKLCFSGHAFYSTHPETLKAVKMWTRTKDLPFSLHLAECKEEVQFLKSGTGDLADFFRAAGILPAEYCAPGLTPVEYAESLGLLDDKTLAVHCVHLSDSDIEILSRKKANVCLCPRSNSFIGAGRARWEDIHAAGLNMCIATDSLVSNEDLNLWNELRYFRKHYQGNLSSYELLAAVTINPATALGINMDFGTLEKGKRAAWCTLPQDFPV